MQFTGRLHYIGVLAQCLGRTSPVDSLVSSLPFAESTLDWVKLLASLRSAPLRLASLRSAPLRSA